MQRAGMIVLDHEDLQARGIKYSKPHLWRLMQAHRFPRRIKLSERRIGWDAAEIDEWLEERKAERTA